MKDRDSFSPSCTPFPRIHEYTKKARIDAGFWTTSEAARGREPYLKRTTGYGIIGSSASPRPVSVATCTVSLDRKEYLSW